MHNLKRITLTQNIRTNPSYTYFSVALSTGTHPVANWPVSGRRLILIADGQSNFAQYFDSVYTITKLWKQFEFLSYDGTLRHLKEPIFGPGSGQLVGSLHSKLGEDLIDAGLADYVIWVPVAIGGTNIYQWASKGEYTHNLISAVNRLKYLGLEPSAILTMRGETDCFAGTSQVDYYNRALEQMNTIRALGCTCPWFIARETYFKTGGVATVSAPVIAAQNQLIASATNVYAGPELDDLGDPYRFEITNSGGDITHFNGGLGRNTVSSRWVTALEANPPAHT